MERLHPQHQQTKGKDKDDAGAGVEGESIIFFLSWDSPSSTRSSLWNQSQNRKITD